MANNDFESCPVCDSIIVKRQGKEVCYDDYCMYGKLDEIKIKNDQTQNPHQAHDVHPCA